MVQLAIAEWTESHWCARQNSNGEFCFDRKVRLEFVSGKYIMRCYSCGGVRRNFRSRAIVRSYIRIKRVKVKKATISSLPAMMRDYHYEDIYNAAT